MSVETCIGQGDGVGGELIEVEGSGKGARWVGQCGGERWNCSQSARRALTESLTARVTAPLGEVGPGGEVGVPSVRSPP